MAAEPTTSRPLPYDPNVELPPQSEISVGIIGMGDMGKMYARRISAAGWR